MQGSSNIYMSSARLEQLGGQLGASPLALAGQPASVITAATRANTTLQPTTKSARSLVVVVKSKREARQVSELEFTIRSTDGRLRQTDRSSSDWALERAFRPARLARRRPAAAAEQANWANRLVGRFPGRREHGARARFGPPRRRSTEDKTNRARTMRDVVLVLVLVLVLVRLKL